MKKFTWQKNAHLVQDITDRMRTTAIITASIAVAVTALGYLRVYQEFKRGYYIISRTPYEDYGDRILPDYRRKE